MTDPDRLHTLIDAYLDERLASDDMAELDALLRSSSEARDAFRAALRDHHALLESLVPRAEQSQPIPAAPKPRAAAQRGPGIAPTIPDRYVYAAAALVAIATVIVGIYLYVSSLPQSEIPDPTSTAPLANLIENASEGTLTTPGGFISEGRDYARGEYALDTGSAEFMLTNAVNVKLRGETRMTMHNAGSVSLTHGSASFVVPQGATGFTVHLPDRSKIVDLGTAFSVSVGDDDATELRVTKGSVRYERADSDGVVFEAGYGLHVDADGLAYGTIAPAVAAVHGFAVRDLVEPNDIASDGLLLEANNIGAGDTSGGVGATPLPRVTVNGIAFGNDQTALVQPIDFSGTFVENGFADADLNTLLSSIAGVKGSGPLRMRYDDLEPGRTYRVQLLVLLSRNDREFVFSAHDTPHTVAFTADVTRGKIVSLTFTADSETFELTITGRPNAANDYAPFINAYVLHEITP